MYSSWINYQKTLHLKNMFATMSIVYLWICQKMYSSLVNYQESLQTCLSRFVYLWICQVVGPFSRDDLPSREEAAPHPEGAVGDDGVTAGPEDTEVEPYKILLASNRLNSNKTVIFFCILSYINS